MHISTLEQKTSYSGIILFQDDDEALHDKQGQKFLKLHEYKVTTTELELLTGLRFPKILYDTNPLYFYSLKGFNELPEVWVFLKTYQKRIIKNILHSKKKKQSD